MPSQVHPIIEQVLKAHGAPVGSVAEVTSAEREMMRRIGELTEALSHIRSEAMAAQNHANEPYMMQVVLEDIVATTGVLAESDGEA